MTIQEKFAGLGIDNAPGQEALQKKEALDLRGEKLLGARVDFSHGDVDAHMPTPGSFDVFKEGFEEGEERINDLYGKLFELGRSEDVKRAVKDAKYREKFNDTDFPLWICRFFNEVHSNIFKGHPYLIYEEGIIHKNDKQIT